MNIKGFREAMQTRKARFTTSLDRQPVPAKNPNRKREIALQIVKFLSETAIVDRRGDEFEASKEMRKYFYKLDKSKLTDSDIDDILVGVRGLFSEEIKKR